MRGRALVLAGGLAAALPWPVAAMQREPVSPLVTTVVDAGDTAGFVAKLPDGAHALRAAGLRSLADQRDAVTFRLLSPRGTTPAADAAPGERVDRLVLGVEVHAPDQTSVVDIVLDRTATRVVVSAVDQAGTATVLATGPASDALGAARAVAGVCGGRAVTAQCAAAALAVTHMAGLAADAPAGTASTATTLPAPPLPIPPATPPQLDLSPECHYDFCYLGNDLVPAAHIRTISTQSAPVNPVDLTARLIDSVHNRQWFMTGVVTLEQRTMVQYPDYYKAAVWDARGNRGIGHFDDHAAYCSDTAEISATARFTDGQTASATRTVPKYFGDPFSAEYPNSVGSTTWCAVHAVPA